MNRLEDIFKENNGAKIGLKPAPIGSWMIYFLVLMLLPTVILYDQAITAFQTIARREKTEVKRHVEGLVAKAKVEAGIPTQIQELLKPFFSENEKIEERLMLEELVTGYYSFCLPNLGDYLGQSILYNYSQRIKVRFKTLRKLIPGIKILRWDHEFQYSKKSDYIKPGWPFKGLCEAITLRLISNDYPDRPLKSYLEVLPRLRRFFGENASLREFVKDGRELYEFKDSTSRKMYLMWEHIDFSKGNGDQKIVGGYLMVIYEDLLPAEYGVETFIARKSYEWLKDGVGLGWINPQDLQSGQLPYPVSSLESSKWKKWLAKKPTGTYERDNLAVAIERAGSNLLLVAYRSVDNINKAFFRKVFFLRLFLILIICLPFWIISFFRKDGGVSLSLRWQMTGLLLLTIGIPVVSVFQFGSELLRERKDSIEAEAYRKLEEVKVHFERNFDFGFEQLETIGNSLGKDISKKGIDFFDKKALESKQLAELTRKYCEDSNLTFLFIFNDEAEPLVVDSIQKKNAQGILPLMVTLAKLKLKFSGKLRGKGKLGAASLMDVMIEESGGMEVSDFEVLLKNRENRAFELKFGNSALYTYAGEFYQESHPDRPFILIMVSKDYDFEKMYIRFMIEKLSKEKIIGDSIQVYFGRKDISGSRYFLDSYQPNPWFAYNEVATDSVKLGRLSDSTRFAGIPVKSVVNLEKNDKKCLFYSFKPIRIKECSLVALYDYQEIEDQLARLRNLIIIIFGVSFIIAIVLARLMARAIILPVNVLKQGVESIQSGNFETKLSLPGQDELVDLAGAFNDMSQGLLERERMSRYLSRSAVEAVKSEESAKLGGKRLKGSILFSDIRSFTTISESNSAEDVVGLLNEYFACMNSVIEELGGDIDKFIGDAIMAQFLPDEKGEFAQERDLACNAVLCGLKMMEALENFNHQRQRDGKFPIYIGVGINSGELISGNIGSPGRMDFTVIGDTVNVASRLEGMSKHGKFTHVIISKSTLELVRDKIEYAQLSETAVKGKTQAVEMYEVIRWISTS